MVLLIISCSARKRKNPRRPIPAVDRYDGVFFNVLRKAARDGRRDAEFRVLIISTKFGIIRERTPIPFYEQRMSPDRVKALKYVIRRKLRQELKSKHFERIYVNVGGDYAQLISDMPELQSAIWGAGSIGKRAAMLKH